MRRESAPETYRCNSVISPPLSIKWFFMLDRKRESSSPSESQAAGGRSWFSRLFPPGWRPRSDRLWFGRRTCPWAWAGTHLLHKHTWTSAVWPRHLQVRHQMLDSDWLRRKHRQLSPVRKSWMAAISGSPFLGVTRLAFVYERNTERGVYFIIWRCSDAVMDVVSLSHPHEHERFSFGLLRLRQVEVHLVSVKVSIVRCANALVKTKRPMRFHARLEQNTRDLHRKPRSSWTDSQALRSSTFESIWISISYSTCQFFLSKTIFSINVVDYKGNF